jgi:hypothetical protein
VSDYFGDFAPGATVRIGFNTTGADRAPITLAGSPTLAVHKDGSATQSTAGVSLSTDFDSLTGQHVAIIDTNADAFYATGSDFRVYFTAGTVDGTSVVGMIVGQFSINNRSALRPTTAGRTLDVSAAGNAGIDWSNVEAPTTTVNLSGTTIAVSQVVASVSGAVGSVTGNVGGNVAGSVASVMAGVTVSDKTGFSLAAAGLDLVVIETGLNLRQATSLNTAALAGVLAGAATATITIKGAGVATTRITATVDSDGNRSALTLNPPACAMFAKRYFPTRQFAPRYFPPAAEADTGGTGPTHFRVDVEAIGAGAIDHVDVEEL